MKKFIVFVMAGALIALGSCASSGAAKGELDALYSGNGGKGMSLAILAPKDEGLADDQKYLLAKIQGVFVRDMTNPYSAISVLDRVKLDEVIKEGESGVYTESADYIRLGEVTQTDYTLTGTIAKTGSGYTLQMQITTTQNGITKATYTGNCTLAELEDFSAVNKAAADLLTKMGVNLTEAGRKALLAEVDTRRVEGQTTLSKGLASDSVIKALSFFIQANIADPELSEAAIRMNIVSRDISSGNIGESARNQIAWRKDWTARLDECDQYVRNFLKDTPLPLNLLYSTELRQGEIDWNRETLPISFDIRLFPASGENWPKPVTMVVDAVYEGLMATGKASDWNLSWPNYSSSIGDGAVRAYDVAVELVNEQGEIIGKETVRLSAGWETGFRDGKAYARKAETSRTVSFGAVNANKLTTKLSIRVASLNGSNAETAAQENHISIADLDGYRLAKYGRTYRIGDAGPSGGLIAYGGLQVPDYFELAPAAFEFTVSWDDAVKKYRALAGNDVRDGRLPSQAELDVMYRDFKVKGRGDFKDDRYWFSGGYQNFSDGNQSGSTGGEYRVRPVRTVSRNAEEERTLAAKWMAELRQWREDFLNTPESWYQGEHTIGEIGPAGGHVFYDAGPNASRGRRFLEAAPASAEFKAAGTDDLVEICKNLEINGIGGWWLPTKEELALMYTNLKQKGIGDFHKPGLLSLLFNGVSGYWSSTTTQDGYIYLELSTGREGIGYGFTKYLVRVVRGF